MAFEPKEFSCESCLCFIFSLNLGKVVALTLTFELQYSHLYNRNKAFILGFCHIGIQ